MKYRVIVKWKIHKFDTYSKALEFSQETGGTLYEQVIY